MQPKANASQKDIVGDARDEEKIGGGGEPEIIQHDRDDPNCGERSKNECDGGDGKNIGDIAFSLIEPRFSRSP